MAKIVLVTINTASDAGLAATLLKQHNQNVHGSQVMSVKNIFIGFACGNKVSRSNVSAWSKSSASKDALMFFCNGVVVSIRASKDSRATPQRRPQSSLVDSGLPPMTFG
jgi:hypothetical protein